MIARSATITTAPIVTRRRREGGRRDGCGPRVGRSVDGSSIGWPSAAEDRDANVPALGYRAPRCFAIAVATTSPMAFDRSGRSAVSRGGSSIR